MRFVLREGQAAVRARESCGVRSPSGAGGKGGGGGSGGGDGSGGCGFGGGGSSGATAARLSASSSSLSRAANPLDTIADQISSVDTDTPRAFLHTMLSRVHAPHAAMSTLSTSPLQQLELEDVAIRVGAGANHLSSCGTAVSLPSPGGAAFFSTAASAAAPAPSALSDIVPAGGVISSIEREHERERRKRGHHEGRASHRKEPRYVQIVRLSL